MQCTNCGTVLPAGARFCPICGTPVSATPPSATGPTTLLDTSFQDFDQRAGARLDLPEPTVVASGEGKTGIDYQIVGTTMQAVIIQLEPGQTIFSETGGMAWMSGNVIMNTTTGGGGGLGGMIGGLVKRALSGESLFIVDYTVQAGRGLIAFASEFPGKIIPLHLGAGQSLIMQRDAFMCAEKTVSLDIHFRRNLGSGLFGGEGFILQRVTGPGVAFAELDGEIVEYTLEAGQVLKVDTGHVAMYEPTVQFDVEMIRGFRNILFGGEGLFLATLRGPGRVWLQTMPAMNLAKKLANYLPRAGGSNSGSQGGLGNLGNLGNFFGGD
ncbi:TIGR00266 family protein [Kallotenue papyrolyticum]|uniref:TIGR00266 family protein n=1 Tax=Kallotenue papyrolyticum TaxID=1325125 RepID=UPI0004786390